MVAEVPDHIVEQVRSTCLALPEVHEEAAWVGTRWMVRTKNFAHVVAIEGGWPAAYAQAAGSDGPLTVLTFRCALDEVEVYRNAGHPYFVPVWFPNIVGVSVDDTTDWDTIEELLVESYCELAPAKLVAQVAGAPGEST